MTVRLSDLPAHVRERIDSRTPSPRHTAKNREIQSDLEANLAHHIRVAKLPPPSHQWKFHPTRDWRFDFAWPAELVAVEVEGGIHIGGRHTRGKGFEADCVKYNEAALLGWRVLRVTDSQIDTLAALRWIERALNLPGPDHNKDDTRAVPFFSARLDRVARGSSSGSPGPAVPRSPRSIP